MYLKIAIEKKWRTQNFDFLRFDRGWEKGKLELK